MKLTHKTLNNDEFNNLHNTIIDYKNIYNTIEILLVILENLGFLDPSEIEKNLDEELHTYDKSIFYRIRILNNKLDIQEIKRRFPNNDLGYGQLKTTQLREKYISLVNRWKNIGKNTIEITEELIFEIKLEIARYEKILQQYNAIVKSLIENKKLSEADKIVMIDYWTLHFKEEKLGYPLNIDQRINSMIENLKKLEFGGYGEKEINKFLDICQEKISFLKNNNMSNDKIINYISESIYSQLIQRYENELLILKKRISLIEDSKVISPKQKSQEIEQFIIDFNERNGHKIDLSNQMLELKKKLSQLKCCKDDNSIVDWFINKAQNIIIEEKRNNKSDKSILAIIKIMFRKYYNYYSNIEKQLESPLQKADFEEQLFEESEELKPSSLALRNKIAEMLSNLKESENYTEEEIIKFKNECYNIERENILIDEIQKSVGEIEKLYEELLIQNSKKRKYQLEQLQNKISTYSDELSKLGNYGYGVSAIAEFKSNCSEIITSKKTYEEKKLLIDQKFRLLKDNYYDNEKIFAIWKEIEVKKKTISDIEADIKIRKMLSLSPKELQLYYEQDDKRKRQAMEHYNNKLLVKFLAQEEAAKTADYSIINKRLKSLEIGVIPYSTKELERAREEIEKKEYLSEFGYQTRSERLVTITEYIESTLYKQIYGIILNYKK